VFDRESLELVLEYGIAVNCGSPDMIDQYGERAPGGEIALRVNPGFGHGHSRKTNTGGETSKHGIWWEDVGAARERAERHGLRVTTLHMHIGSGVDLEHLALVAGAMERCAAEVGPALRTLSTGGGLPVPYRPGDPRIDIGRHFAIWDQARKRLEERFGHALRLEVEPGRYLVAEAGFLVTEIRAIKRMGGNTFYLVDAGFNTLARPVLYGAYHPISLAPADGKPRAEREVVVGGPLCESGDIFTQEEGGVVRTEPLPEAKVGEHLVIERAGAYGFVMSSNYNAKTLPAEVLIREGKAHLVRARQSLSDLVRGESIPESE
jgi:diaminopimelate decarboxylase